MGIPTMAQLDRGRSATLGRDPYKIHMYKRGRYYVVYHQQESAAYWSYEEAREHVARLLIITGALYGHRHQGRQGQGNKFRRP